MDESIATVAQQLLDRTRAFVREERLPGAAVGVVGRAGLAWAGAAGFADLAAARRPAACFLIDDRGAVTMLNIAGYPYRRLRVEGA